MSISAMHVIQHDFNNIKEQKAALAFVFNTIEQLKKRLFIKGVDNLFDLEVEPFENEMISYSFYLPYYNLWFYLYNGYWDVYSMFEYNRLISHKGIYFPLRCQAFDIARALGQSEAWHASEDYESDAISENLASWLNYANEKIKREEFDDRHITEVPEFCCEDILASGEDDTYEYVNAYHDDFKECFEYFQYLQKRLKDMELLGLYRIGNNFLRCKKDNGLFLVNEDTLQPLFDEPVDCVLNSFHYYYSGKFVVIKDGYSAVFDENGKPLTDFVNGTFRWVWGSQGQIVYNDEAQIAFEIKIG